LFHFNNGSVTRLLDKAGFGIVEIKTGTSKSSFLGSADCVYRNVLGSRKKHGGVLRHVAGIGCLLLGHLGYGGDLKVVAEKPS
jgi:hypothetical protein